MTVNTAPVIKNTTMAGKDKKRIKSNEITMGRTNKLAVLKKLL